MVELHPVASAEAIRDLRLRMGASQAELDALLRLTEGTVAAIESNQRIEISAAQWNRLREATPSLQEPLFDLSSDVVDRYEGGVSCAARGELRKAEEVLASLMTEPSAHPYIRLRSTMWVAGIRRDRFEIEGPEGALHLYHGALPVAIEQQRAKDLTELHLVIGACYEMSNRTDRAIHRYHLALRSAGALRERTRLNTRLGAILTKVGSLDEAAKHLSVSIRDSEQLDDAFPYSFGHEKRAILRIAVANYDGAHKDLMQARQEIPEGSPLRTIQSLVVETHLNLALRQTASARDSLRVARALAIASDYKHQLSAIEDIQKRIDRLEAGSRGP